MCVFLGTDYWGYRETIRWVKIVETAGPDYITVHGRRRSQKSTEPVNTEAVRRVKEVAGVPVVLNGDVFCMEDVQRLVGLTGVDGKYLLYHHLQLHLQFLHIYLYYTFHSKKVSYQLTSTTYTYSRCHGGPRTHDQPGTLCWLHKGAVGRGGEVYGLQHEVSAAV